MSAPTLSPPADDDRGDILIGLMIAALSGGIVGALITFLVMR